ncbi:MAG: ATP-dependent zinc metalloprotease FtsH [Deltaproteobacteria bacterium]|nr:ATP-dependent zinc metalloprotease FtsH [Deltaproteobacteria bacterium]
MGQIHKSLIFWLILGLMMILLFNSFSPKGKKEKEIVFSEFVTAVASGEVASVTIQGNKISGKFLSGASFKTFAPNDPDLVKMLREKGIEIAAKPENESSVWHSVLISWLPMLLLIGVWIFFMRQMQIGGGKAMSFGKSRAKIFLKNQDKKVTFKDVAGIEESKEEVTEIIEFLKDPQRFTKLGGRIPKGVLLVGPPGTGKTLLARAIAGEADVPFFNISGSDFVEMFVGVGASRVRDLFIQAKRSTPCIIFIDEIDAVGRYRGAGLGGGHDEREQTLNQLLVEMDGFEVNEGIILIAATNRPDILDTALLRPGRFDRQVMLPIPDIKGREQILKVHSRNSPLANDVDLKVLARGTPGFTGADLENLVNEAALLAAKQNKKVIDMQDLEQAKDKVMMGTERRSMIISEEEKKDTAYHEAGHALVAKLVPGSDPIHKVTIIPRGHALGITQQLPLDERHIYSRDYLITNITTLMGGRAAEGLVLQRFTTGAGNDIEKATEVARKMVCEWGMSDSLGPLAFGQKEEQIFRGREIAQHRDYSEMTAQEIDREIKRIVMECYERAKEILKKNIDTLHKLAQTLLERESLTGDEIDQIIYGGALA